MNRITRSLAPVLAGAMGLLLVGAVAITVCEPVQATHITKKAVYRDETRHTNWIGQPAAQIVTDYLVGQGYEVLTASTIRAWLDARIADRLPSVLVSSHDTLPDEALFDNGQLNPTGVPSPSNPIRRYLLSGGRMVAISDIPFYLHGTDDQRNEAGWANNGAVQILGFNTSPGTRDLNVSPTITAEGTQWGLTVTDTLSVRPAAAADVDVALALDDNGQASWWIKYFTTVPGRGEFIRLWDIGLSQTELTDELLADLKRVAEYDPAGADGTALASGIEGKIIDDKGQPAVGINVRITQDKGPKILASTDPNGRFFAMLAAGSYTVAVPSSGNYVLKGVPSNPVTVNAGAMTTLPDIKAIIPPMVDLLKENGFQWKILLGPDVASDADFSKVNADESGFTDWDVTATVGNWTTYLDSIGEANGDYDGWLRLRFQIPEAWKANYRGSDLHLYGFNFNAADETFFNGQRIGITGRMKSDPAGPLRVADLLRDYTIKGDLVNWDGDNVIAIHGWHDGGTGGFTAARPKLAVILDLAPPKVQLTKDNGFSWKIYLDPEVDPMADFSAVNADESVFESWDVNPGAGNWTAYLDSKGVGNGNMDGWLRLRFTLPASWGEKWKSPLTYTANFNAADEVYFNGVSIGKTGLLSKDPGGPVRNTATHTYEIPANLVNWTGENVIAIHGWHDGGTGAFTETIPTLAATAESTPTGPDPGDLNDDKKINVQDATLSLRIAVGLLTPTAAQIDAGDVNNDGKLNIQDTTLILQVAVGNKPATDLK